MDTISLTGKAIQYLARRLGATELWGFADAFEGETDEEVSRDFVKIEEELIGCNYGDMNFDGKFQVDSEVEKFIRACFDFDRYISAELRVKNAVTNNRLFFMKGGTTAMLEAVKDVVKISPINASDIPDVIMNLDVKPVWLACGNEARAISLSDLGSLKDGKKAEEKLIKKGIPAEMIEALSKGISENCALNAMVVLERNSGDITMRSHTMMYSSGGAILITIPENSEDDNVWIEPVQEGIWRAQLERILLKKGGEAK
jgi:hypothetical protein